MDYVYLIVCIVKFDLFLEFLRNKNVNICYKRNIFIGIVNKKFVYLL